MNFPRPTLVIDRAIPFLAEALSPYAEVITCNGSAITREVVRTADALVVRTRTQCDERLLAGSSVRLVVTATIGYDHIDRAWCEANGIRVVTAAGCNARGVLQWVAAVLAQIARKEGWHPSERTLGVVGVGNVGWLVKAYAEQWGFRLICCDPPREERERLGFRPIEEVAEAADILTFHTPLDRTTYHLCSGELIGRMKPSAWILNAARGAVVDQEALLESNHPFALDVWEGEPQLHPEVLRRAALATPHVAGYTAQGKANASAIALRAVADFFHLPIGAWYPQEVTPPAPRPIAWEELIETIDTHYDITAESALLKAHPERFEAFRDQYRLRLEYF